MLRGITFIRAGKTKEEKVKRTYHSEQNIRFLVCFFAGIVAGTLFLNFFCGGSYEKFGIFSEYFIDKFEDVDVNMKDLFLYSFWNRCKEMLLILLLSLTSFGCIVPEGFLVYKGMEIGVLISVYVMQYGIGGVVLYFLSVFPHYIIYVIFVIMLVELAKEIYKRQKEKKWSSLGTVVKCLFILLVLNLLTAYLETFVNLKIIRNVLL